MRFEINTDTPSITVNGATLPVDRVIVETTPDGPIMTVWGAAGTITGDGVMQVVEAPTEEQVIDQAKALISTINPVWLEQAVASKLKTGTRNPYAATLETILESL